MGDVICYMSDRCKKNTNSSLAHAYYCQILLYDKRGFPVQQLMQKNILQSFWQVKTLLAAAVLLPPWGFNHSPFHPGSHPH